MAIRDEIESLFAQGEISSEDLLLAAYLGDSAAAEMMGDSPGPDQDLASWVEGIGDRGAYPLMFLCTRLARQCLKSASEQLQSLEDLIPAESASLFQFKAAKRCLRVAEDYLEQPGHDDQKLMQAGESARRAAQQARLCATDFSESSEVATELLRVAQAFSVLAHTLAVFLWTPNSSSSQDDLRQSTWSAVRATMGALDLQDDAMRELIRGILIPWHQS